MTGHESCKNAVMILEILNIGGAVLQVRKAELADLGALIDLMTNDPVRQAEVSGSEPNFAAYEKAYHAIDADPAQLLVAVTNAEQTVVGTMQLTFIPGLARMGATRMQIEAVRVAESQRGTGIGSAMIQWAIAWARTHGANLVQLTSDNQRGDAHRFYERLGFAGSHTGFKLTL